jgi:acylphosphatase
MTDAQPAGEVRCVVRVEGRVQGVNYRVSARRRARELGIKAHPENLDDGSVRIVVVGPRAAVDQFVAWCHDGPRLAEVTRVTVREES